MARSSLRLLGSNDYRILLSMILGRLKLAFGYI